MYILCVKRNTLAFHPSPPPQKNADAKTIIQETEGGGGAPCTWLPSSSTSTPTTNNNATGAVRDKPSLGPPRQRRRPHPASNDEPDPGPTSMADVRRHPCCNLRLPSTIIPTRWRLVAGWSGGCVM